MRRLALVVLFIQGLFNCLSQSANNFNLENEAKIFYGASMYDSNTVTFFSKIMASYEAEFTERDLIIDIGIPSSMIFEQRHENDRVQLMNYLESEKCDTLYPNFIMELVKKSKANDHIILWGINGSVNYFDFATISEKYKNVIDANSLACISRIINDQFENESSRSDTIRIMELYDNLVPTNFESIWDYDYTKNELHQLLYGQIYVDSVVIQSIKTREITLISLRTAYSKKSTIEFYGHDIEATSVLMASANATLKRKCKTKIVRNRHYERHETGMYLEKESKVYVFSPSREKYKKASIPTHTYRCYGEWSSNESVH